MKKAAVLLLIVAAVWLVLMGGPSWAAPRYLGESTWTISVTQDESPESFTGTVTGGITHMGGPYYTVHAYINLLPDDGPVIMVGGGVLIGETLYLNLTTAQQHTDNNWRDTGVMHVQLNKTTLNGTLYEVGHDFDTDSIGPSPFFSSRFTAGTLTLTGPPIVLSSTLAGPNLLLLTDE